MTCTRGPMTGSSVDNLLQHYVFPLQLAFMIVISYKGAKHIFWERNNFVAGRTIMLLGIADFCLLLTMLPQSLATFHFFYENEFCRRFVHYSKIWVNAWSNIFSSTEVYLTVAVAAECYYKASSATFVKFFAAKTRYYAMIVCICVLSFAISSYHFVLYSLVTGLRCNGTKLVSKLKLSDTFSEGSVRFLNLTQALVVILLPCLLVVYFNGKLKSLLRDGKLPLLDNERQELCGSTEFSPNPRKVLRTLDAISVIFVLSHVLSFVPFLYDIFPSLYLSEYFPSIITIINSCLVSGKLVNLALLYKSCKQLEMSGFA